MEGQTVFTKLSSPRAVKAAISECDRVGRDVFLMTFGFHHSREYVLSFEGAEYDSKAIAAVAFGYQYGVDPLRPDQCTGGKDHGRAGWALDRLGFRVAGIRHKGWWIDEVEASVSSYMDMMIRSAAGETFQKSDYLKKLTLEFPERSYKAHEYKFQNISAAMKDLGRPWMNGYAPLSRYQQLVRFVLEDRLGRTAPIVVGKATSPKSHISKIDWAKRDADNRALGKGGELHVFELERLKLVEVGRADLAERVRWLAGEGDGHGFDISSFDADGSSICIEVKTTTRGSDAPFFVSDNEVRVSSEKSASYRLYRVFNFLSQPSITIYRGAISEFCEIKPTNYRATPRKLSSLDHSAASSASIST